jgi:hypothetical protein
LTFQDPVSIPRVHIGLEVPLAVTLVDRGIVSDDAGRLANDSVSFPRRTVGLAFLEQSPQAPVRAIGAAPFDQRATLVTRGN